MTQGSPLLAPESGRSAQVRASIPRRLVAFGIDYLILAVYIAILVVLGVTVGDAAWMGDFVSDPLRGQLLGLVLLTLPVILYFAAWESSAKQATPGKRVLGLHVVSRSGERLTWGRSLLRSALKFLPWELAHTCLWRIPGWPDEVETIPVGVTAGLVLVWLLAVLYLVTPMLSRLGQAPYDRAAASLVVETDRGGVLPSMVGTGSSMSEQEG